MKEESYDRRSFECGMLFARDVLDCALADVGGNSQEFLAEMMHKIQIFCYETIEMNATILHERENSLMWGGEEIKFTDKSENNNDNS